MDRNKLVVRLLPKSKSPFEIRVLTLSSEQDKIVVGRSSKTHANLHPSRENAWFDSPVMSRTHAIITACPGTKQASVVDTDSMHGTLLNGKRLTANTKAVVKNEDILTFGSTISRGSKIYKPLSVSVLLSWNPTEDPPKPSESHSANTFVVPDDDDDDGGQDSSDPQAEAIFANTSATKAISREPSASANSEVGSAHPSSNDGGQESKSSPSSSLPSSPPSNSESKGDNSTSSKQVIPSQHAPDSDVETAMPTLIENDGIHNTVPKNEHAQVSKEGPDSGFDADREDLGLEIEADSDSGQHHVTHTHISNENADHTTETDIPRSSENLEAVHAPFSVPDKIDLAPERADMTSQPECPRPTTTATTGSMPKLTGCDNDTHSAFISPIVREELVNTVQPPTSGCEQTPAEETQTRDRNLALGSKRSPSPSDKALAKPTAGVPYLTFHDDNTCPRWVPAANKCQRAFGSSGSFEPDSSTPLYGGTSVASDYGLPHLPPLRPLYSDGPFAASSQGDNNWLGDAVSARDQALAENSRDIYRFDSPYSPAPGYGPSSGPAYPGSTRCQSQSQSQSQFQSHPPWQLAFESTGDVPNNPPQSKYANPVPKDPIPAASIPIANIVDAYKQTTESNRPTNPRKRKAREVNPEPVSVETLKSINDFYNGNEYDNVENDSFPEAQPRDLLVHQHDLPSQFKTTNNEPHGLGRSFKPTKTDETAHLPPQAKKIKTETPAASPSLARYAASALLGAAVGGIGVVVALASLPPDFFN
ncbi:predicted protein [Histoplasma capsulatum G186AR]|uniref:FHA domain-containing protein n=2 Tax=Ajellomyces capsulatus TaxID=5037 RepID=C0NZM5_AJECG|nr:uncharacterized protein HCBG_08605 [Histoplasma capsulatum G186AR]EEH03273.1 predicted protein [Histoplasma capsulatum G186AR]KAG5290321.1 FHA domain-containing protein, nitrositive stress-induced transcript [Histoplasma capsulatum]QSS72248.1 FHA domain-containing protein, nitrositive stress-induced transcript [Histoplasma capsulatum G186AR]